MSLFGHQLKKDNELWEEKQMKQGGIIQRDRFLNEFDDTEKIKNYVVVRDLRPPFISSELGLRNVEDSVQTVRDPMSDMVVLSK